MSSLVRPPPSPPRTRTLKEVQGAPRSAARSLWRTQKSRNPEALLIRNVLPWIANYLRVALLPKHDFVAYPIPPGNQSTGVFDMPDSCVVALAADWGTGTSPAYRVAKDMAMQKPDFTIHLGEVYYSGTLEEFRDYFLPSWPRGSQRTLILNGNHEMYSGGSGYFDFAFSAVSQRASYFCLENKHWRIIGLDTGYYARTFPLLEPLLKGLIRLPDSVVKWLQEIVFRDPKDRRPTILLSHHPWFSSFDAEYGGIGTGVLPYLDRTLLWFWGHEHRFSGYGRFGPDSGPSVRARCLGHGGMPIELGEQPKRSRNLVFYDARQTGTVDGQPIGACGYAVIRFKGSILEIEYRDENGTSLLLEEWTAALTGTRGRVVRSSPDLSWLQPVGRLVE